jgi:hypothetical protein
MHDPDGIPSRSTLEFDEFTDRPIRPRGESIIPTVGLILLLLDFAVVVVNLLMM